MMNRSQLFMKKIVFNSKLNREKFTNNKKKFKTNMVIKRQYHMNPDPSDPGPDWNLMALIALVGFCVTKINGKTK